ncbi:MAG: glycosyltransferase family 4 protein, partial [Armatimonadota bacterium]
MSRGADVHFVVAGDGPHRTLVETRARTLGVDARFRILGLVLDVPAFLAGLDVFVFPSRSEGFGLALVEALAAGLPCIASNVG